MPRIRTVKPEYWSHPVMGRQKDEVKTMGVALLNWSDDQGYFYADPATIRSFARPFDDDSKTTLGCLQQLMKIEYIEVRLHPVRGFVGRVLSFDEHQRVDKPKPSKIKKFFDEAIPTISLVLIPDESTTLPAGKEGIGRESKEEVLEPSKSKPSARGARSAPNGSQVSRSLAETKHHRIAGMIIAAWNEHNPGATCPFGEADGKQLKLLLEKTTGWPDTNYMQCLANIYKTEGFPRSELPMHFLPRLPSYFSAPRDRYSRELGNGSGNSKGDRRAADISKTTREVFGSGGVTHGDAPTRLQVKTASAGVGIVAGNSQGLLVSGIQSGDDPPDKQPTKI